MQDLRAGKRDDANVGQKGEAEADRVFVKPVTPHFAADLTCLKGAMQRQEGERPDDGENSTNGGRRQFLAPCCESQHACAELKTPDKRVAASRRRCA
jgi:hypothetical protein